MPFSIEQKNNTLYFFAGLLFVFGEITYAKFQAASFGDLLLNEKQKKPFVLLKDDVTIIP